MFHYHISLLHRPFQPHINDIVKLMLSLNDITNHPKRKINHPPTHTATTNITTTTSLLHQFSQCIITLGTLRSPLYTNANDYIHNSTLSITHSTLYIFTKSILLFYPLRHQESIWHMVRTHWYFSIYLDMQDTSISFTFISYIFPSSLDSSDISLNISIKIQRYKKLHLKTIIKRFNHSLSSKYSSRYDMLYS